MQDGDFTLADSTAICLYLDRKQPASPILPADIRDYARVLWFDAYAGAPSSGMSCIRCSSRRSSAQHPQRPTDKSWSTTF
jgi:glutathione S-transferase